MNLFHCLVPLIVLVSFIKATQFIEQPKSQNVSLGSSVVFNCTGYSLGHHWLVNGELTESEDNKNRGFVKEDEIVNDDTNLKIHLLTVPATMNNNGITVVCYIYTQMTIASDTAVLQIQGLLNNVTDLEAECINCTSFKVSFNPPHTLDGVPIANYSIKLIPLHSQVEFMPPSVEYHTVDPEIVVSDTRYNECDSNYMLSFNISVTPWNEVGKGETLSIVFNDIFEDCFSSTSGSTSVVHTPAPSSTSSRFSISSTHSYPDTSSVSRTSIPFNNASSVLIQETSPSIITASSSTGISTGTITAVAVSASILVLAILTLTIVAIVCWIIRSKGATDDSWRLEFAMVLYNRKRTSNDYVSVNPNVHRCSTASHDAIIS